MASLNIPDMPEELLVALRAAAEAKGRTLEEEIVETLKSALAKVTERTSTREVQIASWRLLAGQWTAGPQVTEPHDARTPGRDVDFDADV